MPLRLSRTYRSYAGSALFSLNYIQYVITCTKKIVHGHRTSCAKKRVIIVFNVHIVIIVQKDIVALEKVAFLRAIMSNL